MFKFVSTFFLVLLTTPTFSSAQEAVDASTQCACAFAEDNESDCYVYGPNPDGGEDLVAYPRIADGCIYDIGARLSYIEALDFWRYCPYPNSTQYGLEDFLILIRQHTATEQAQYVMSNFIRDMDFEIFANNSGVYGLPEIMTNNLAGREYNCTDDEVECWNQVKAQVRNRTPRWDIICGAWHDRVIPQFKAEQGLARQLLCEGGFNETELQFCVDVEGAFAPRSNCAALNAQAEPPSDIPVCTDAPVRNNNGSGAAENILAMTWGTVVIMTMLAVGI